MEHEQRLELWLIRHGETTHNFERRIQGQFDSELTELGVAQAKKLAPRLAQQTFDQVYSSDLKRAHDTAQLALPDADIILDKRLREISFGVLEDKTQDELSDDERDIYVHVKADRFNRAAPGGESWSEHVKRTESWLADLPKTGRVAAFAHGGCVRALVFSILQHHPKNYEWNVVAHNTSISKFSFGESGAFILSLNDAAHLEEGSQWKV